MICIHDIQIETCLICTNDSTLAGCEICGLIGSYNVMQDHAIKQHASVSLPIPLSDEPVHVCSCGIHFHHIDEHLRTHHPFTVKSPTLVCNHNNYNFGTSLWYCQECIVDNTCRLCNRILKTPYGAIKHFNDLHLSNETAYKRYKCSYVGCSFTFTSHVPDIYTLDNLPQYVLNHLVKHMRQVYACPVSGCKVNMLTCQSISSHYEIHHFKYECQMGKNCGLGPWCNSPILHIQPLELHASMVSERDNPQSIYRMKYVNVSDLEYTTYKYPVNEIEERVKTARQRCELEYAPNPDDLTRPSGETLPDDMWLSIMAFMDMEELFIMTKVSHRMRCLATLTAQPFDKFMFNLQSYYIKNLSTVHYSQMVQNLFLLDTSEIDHIDTSLGIYYLFDVGKYLYDKYLTWDAYKAHVDLKKKKEIVLLAQIKLEEQNRRQILTDLLATRSLEIRDDSKMCSFYILNGHGINGETVEEIVDIMEEMAWLYQNTTYFDTIEARKREYIMDGLWYDLSELIKQAKRRAIRTWVQKHGATDDLPVRIYRIINPI
jgi:hypothetical protein